MISLPVTALEAIRDVKEEDVNVEEVNGSGF